MLWIGSGRFDGRIGDIDGPRACRGPDAGIVLSSSRPTGRSGLGYRVGTALGTHLSGETSSSTASGTQRQFAGP